MTTSPTAPGTTCATRSTRRSSGRSSAGRRGTPTSATAWPPPSTGTGRTRRGGGRSKSRSRPSTRREASDRGRRRGGRPARPGPPPGVPGRRRARPLGAGRVLGLGGAGLRLVRRGRRAQRRGLDGGGRRRGPGEPGRRACGRGAAAGAPPTLAAVRGANVDAVGFLADAARRHGFTLVHISSEYVFDGRHPGPIPEDLPPSPLSVYGRSKADGDRLAEALDRHYLVRTTWVVGEGGNFVRTMASPADRGVSPTVVDDQIGRPTFAPDLAAGIRHLVATAAPFGTYNLTNSGKPASWAEVASAVFEARGRSASDVGRVSTAEYFADKPAAAPRPLNSVLDLAKIRSTGFAPREWRPALAEYLG